MQPTARFAHTGLVYSYETCNGQPPPGVNTTLDIIVHAYPGNSFWNAFYRGAYAMLPIHVAFQWLETSYNADLHVAELSKALLTYLPTYLPTYLLTYLLTYLFTYLLTYLLTCSPSPP